MSHILCPHLRPCPNRTLKGQRLYCAWWTFQDDVLPLFLTIFSCTLFYSLFYSCFFFVFLTHIHIKHTLKFKQVHSGPRHGGRSPLLPVLYVWFLEGDPILFSAMVLGGLAGSGATRRALAWRLRLGQCAQKLMNCRRDVERQPARSSGKRPSRAITVCSCDGGNRRDSADNLI